MKHKNKVKRLERRIAAWESSKKDHFKKPGSLKK